jgi:hypothetical protein
VNTANAISADSNAVPDAYRPSQSPYARADLPWARATATGVVAARAEIEDAFGNDTEPTDVPFARRDWTFLPEGEVVAIDRVRTGDASRNTYLRFRSAAALSKNADGATGTIGSSTVVIHTVTSSGGSPGVAKVAVDDCWTSSNYGDCKGARIAVDEYALTQPGPQAFALHVIDALGTGEAPATAKALDDTGVLGTVIDRGAQRSVVLSSRSAVSGVPSTLTYTAPGDKAARHVVFDAPEDSAGRANVTAAASGATCVISAAPGAGITGRPLVFSVAAAADGCTIQEDAPAPSGGGSSSGGTSSGGSSSGGSSGGGTSSGGSSGGSSTSGGMSSSGESSSGGAPGSSGCSSIPAPTSNTTALAMLGFVTAMSVRRRRR